MITVVNRSTTSEALRAVVNCLLAGASALNASASTPSRSTDDWMVSRNSTGSGAMEPASTVVHVASPPSLVAPTGHRAQ